MVGEDGVLKKKKRETKERCRFVRVGGEDRKRKMDGKDKKVILIFIFIIIMAITNLNQNL